MFNRIHGFLSKCNILSKDQYGFRPGHSTELALADAITKLYTNLDSKKTTLGVFLDLSKAFDTIDHHILLHKLEVYGIRGNALNLIYSYLTGRLQFTSLKSTESDLREIKCGVPQGSILGPLLFIIYVNDMHLASSKFASLYFADNTTLFSSVFYFDNERSVGKTHE